jgi:hypothetical protein
MESSPEPYRQHLIARLAAQPEELRHVLERSREPQTRVPLEPGGWSAHRVLAHVVETERQAFAPRIRRILEEDEPFLPSFDEGPWMSEHYDEAEPLASLLDRWQAVRAETLRRVQGLPTRAWNRMGIHPERGRRSLQWWVEYAAAHAQEHLEQIAR